MRLLGWPAAAFVAILLTGTGVAVAATRDTGSAASTGATGATGISAAKQKVIDMLEQHPPPPSPGTVFLPPAGGRAPAAAPTHPAAWGQILDAADSGGVPLPYPDSLLHTVNFWLGTVGPNDVGVYAGEEPGSPGQGALFVSTMSLQANDAAAAPHLVPTPHLGGAAKIQSVSPPVIIVTDSGGSTYTFDLRTQTFVP